MLRLIRTDQEGNTMRITIDIDTEREPLSESDKAVLRAIASGGIVPITASGGVIPVASSAGTHGSAGSVDVPEVKAPPVKAPTPKASPKKAAPEPEVAPSATETTEAEPEVTPEPEVAPEPKATSTDLPVMELLVKQAAELISSGERARVKVALEAVGAGRVSEVTPDQAEAFMKALG